MGYVNKINISSSSHLIEPTLYVQAAGTSSAYTANIADFALVSGVAVNIKFTTTNAAEATLNVTSTGAKSIYYNGAKITASQLKAHHTYTFVYDGTNWQLVGDLDTNTWRPLGSGADDAAAGNHNHDSAYAPIVNGGYLPLSGGTMAGDIKGNQTVALGTTANPFHNIVLGGTTNATMTAASTNPRITFQEGTGTQPVHLIYTDQDNYRSPAGLKVVGQAVSGNLSSPAWLEVEGNIYAAAFKGKADSAYHASAAHFSTMNTYSSGIIKIKIKKKTSWMLTFTIRAYQGYSYEDFVISGYNYGTSNWYSPSAFLMGSHYTTKRTVTFGYDDDATNNYKTLWVSIPIASYSGVDIFNVTNGYTQITDWSNTFEIIYEATSTGTVQTTIDCYRPWYRNEAITSIAATDNVTDSMHLIGVKSDATNTLLYDSHITIKDGAINASTYNNLTLTAATTGFTISGGTTSKTLNVNDNITLKTGTKAYLAYYSDNGVISGHGLAHFADEYGASVQNKKNELVLGNSKAKTTNGSSWGQLALYSPGTVGTYLKSEENSTSWSTATLQAKSGTIAYLSDITDIEIGGRNLLKNSHTTAQDYIYPTSSYSDKASWTTATVLYSGTYTLSFWAKSTVANDKIRVHFYNPSNISSVKFSNGGALNSTSDGGVNFTLTTTWTKYWATYTIPIGTSTRSVIIPRLVSGAGTGTISIMWEKLEVGNKATDWSPAWEDLALSNGSNATGTWGISITGSAGSVAWANTGHPDTFTPSSHTHGNLSNDGKITTAITLAQNDYLIVGDSSESGKIGKGPVLSSSISSQTTSTKFLREDGSWATPSYLTIGTSATTAMAGNTTVTNVAISADTTTNKNYALVFGTTPSDGTSPTAAKTEGLQKNSAKFYVNPSSGALYATKLYSNNTEVSVNGHTHSYLSSISWSGDSNCKLKQSVNGGTVSDVLQFAQGSNITLTGAAGKLTIAGTANDAVTQTGVTDNQELSILLKGTNNTTDKTEGIKYGKTSGKLITANPSTGAITAPGGFVGNASSATKVTAKLAATTKTYLLGTSTTITSTAQNVDLIGDTGVYLTATEGDISAVRHTWNVGGTNKAYTTYNTTLDCIDFVFN